jgi:DNA-binding winged helix-turn-helix (wHTH) protein
VHPLFQSGHFTIHAGVFVGSPKGSLVPFVLPDQATLDYIVIHHPDEDPEVVRSEIEAWIATESRKDAWLRERPPRVVWTHHWLAQQFLFLISDATMPLLEGAAHPGRLMMDQKSRRVWVNQQQLVPPLSAQQFKMLWLLYESQGQVVSRPELVAVVWGDEQAAGVSDQALDALIRRLRDRLASLDPLHQYISTVRGHGVRLDNPPA